MKEKETLETTLGDLIEALTKETASFVREEKETNIVIVYILADLLCHSGRIAENRPVKEMKRDERKIFVVH